MNVFAGYRVMKAQRLCMKRLTRYDLKTILYKLFVFRKGGSFPYPITAIGIIIEQRMTDVLHVCTDLVCTPRLQFTFYQCYITKTFQYFPVGHRMFSIFTSFFKYIHQLAVLQ